MITNVYLISFVMGCLLLFEWRRLRGSRKKQFTRWMMVAVFGVSWGIWMYLTLGEPLFHPIMWLSEQLEPFSPKGLF
jgi:hypothetical protein